MKNLTRSGAPIGACPEVDLCVPLFCTHCRAEIPPDAVLTFEGADYAVHFCGLGCLEVWTLNYASEMPDSAKL
ncbi:MAG: DUF3330 domain-containing protein [Betaproteobacteria bacterium]